MTILVTGGTGKVGSEVVRHLLGKGVSPRVLVRDASKATLPPGAEPVTGDLTDVASVRAALKGVDTLFLLNAVVPDELTQALTAVNLAQEAGIKGLVYLSVLNAESMPEVPHIASKLAVERTIEALGLPTSVLNAPFFMQNDLGLKDSLMFGGVYPVPIGDKGIAAIDVRDLGEVAALELIRRDSDPSPLPIRRITVCGPDVLTGPAIAGIWSETLGRNIAHGGNDLDKFEAAMTDHGTPSWMAYELRLMFRGMHAQGQIESGAAEKLQSMLGRPLRSYRDFAREAAAAW